jgi:DNA-directed RNA polymerase specialized sigma24 family protein
MNNKDKEVLEALTDYFHFRRFIKKVETYARNKAFALDVSEDAVFEAVDKVTDWLIKGDKVNHPASYVNAIIRNALIDYGRADKSADDITQRDLAELGDKDEDGRIGWRVLTIAEKPRKNIKKGSLSTMSESCELVTDSLRALDLAEWAEPNKVKQAYDQLTKQFNGIPGAGQKRVMEYYLRGYRQVDIVDQLGKSKAYVSGIINKWLRIWGWGEKDVERSRGILLTRQLAELYLNLPSQRDLPQKLYHEVTSSFETKAYFRALPESESEDLVKLCESWVYDYAPEIEPDWWKYADNEAFESWRNEKKARAEFFGRLPKEKRPDYLRAWREEAEYWKNNRLLNLVAELEKKLTF